MLQQLRHHLIELSHTHVKDHGLQRPGQRTPVQRIALRTGGRHKRNRLRYAALCQWNTRAGRSTQRCSNARHNHHRNASVAQHLQLFTATSEHKRIAAFDPCHTQATARMLQQQRVDVLLRDFMIARQLADIDLLGIAACTVDDHLRHQPVVQQHIGLLQQLLRANGEQVRITRTHADQIHLTQLRRRCALCRIQLQLHRAICTVLCTRQHLACDRTGIKTIPESQAIRQRRKHSFNGSAPTTGKGRQFAQTLGQQHLDLCTHAPRQGR